MVETLLRPTMVPNLRLLTSGPLPPNPAELLGSKRMKSVLNELGSIADLVIVDSPPVTVLSDSVTLAKAMDGVLLVFRKGITRQGAAKRAIAALQQVQVHCLGVVINGVPERELGYHYSYNATTSSRIIDVLPTERLRRGSHWHCLSPLLRRDVVADDRILPSARQQDGNVMST